ncbi:MAG: CoA-acylating methylmalonate-semialdehyde dehydrogenase [candidate division Zixibacteria bacterium]|nr:CoA-acylating methylmalonate-semialdehyde dehydrogenase [candidate division Zixibacteria bacterium]
MKTDKSCDILPNYVGGKWIEPAGGNELDVINPATGEKLGIVRLSSKAEMDQAISVAKDAFRSWRDTPPVDRARYFFKLKELLEEDFENLSRILTMENGKTLAEARGSVRRGIENVEAACGMPSLMQGYTLEDVAVGIDCQAVRQPMGVFGCITPFNFPAMVPLWFFPTAVACGNTFVVKPSEQTPLSQRRMFELVDKAGFPPGVINLVNGDGEAAGAMISNPDIKGVSFVGSSAVAESVYKEASKYGKRVQALGGAKNFVVVMPDCELDSTVSNLIDSIYGCAGERCLAASVVLAVGDIYDRFKAKLHEAAKKIKIGNGLDESVNMGPVISEAHKARVVSYIEKGVAEGADLLLDGRDAEVTDCLGGFFVGPTLFDNVKPDMTIAREEIFGPVASIIKVKDIAEALDIIHGNEYGNATSIYTSSGKHVRRFTHEVGISMIGVNIGVAAPMAFFMFGGTNKSFFGDLKAYGRDGIEFYTDKRVIISRWF